ncbi:MAG: flagellar biosynthetic protein FliO [Desulfobacterales bacterium]|nr:flagellar biosynthetic protein FliO [Deltaproteobacteria bacterium]NNL77870.1 flagellar biosynthetic protein FliO [Desulfobacterales bacterium]
MNTAPDLLSTAWQMLTALGIVLGGLLVVFYVLKRFLKKDVSGSNEQLIRVIANHYVGVKKNIALVEVPGAVLVVGVSNDNISLLTKIEDQVVLDGIRHARSQTTPSFADHLQRLTAKIKITKHSD